jgi:KaiC/GvpD/RAD55 family RecA-like ATPase
MTGAIIGQPQFGGIWFLAPVAAVIVVASILVLRRRKTTQTTVTVIEKPVEGTVPKLSTEPSIATGYRELDGMLAGGLPEGYAVALVSQSYDERDLLVRKIIQSSLASGRPTFYLSNDIARTRDLTARFSQNFFALSPMADKIGADRPNLLRIPDVGDLSNLNITSHGIIETKSGTARSKLIVIDLLSDLLLRNKVLTTRRWLTDFIGRRKATGFTVIATLDPSIASKEDVQAIVGVFDGVIEFFERELQERARRFLVIKKMYGREYSDSELMLDRQALI